MSENQQQPAVPFRTTVEAPEPWQRVVKAEVDRAAFDKEYAARLKKAVRGHQKAGFRKGRTPRGVVEKEMGGLLRSEAIEALIPKVWMAALMEHRLMPLTDPSLDNFSFEDEGPMCFDLTVEVKPEIEITGYDALPVRRRAAEVEDADVDQVMERLRASRAVHDAVDRAAAEGDQITLDLTPDGGEDEPAADTIADQKFILGAESNMPAFNTELVGVKAGDKQDVAVEYPAEHPNEQLQGRTITFHCEIKEVAEEVLPEVDDAFAAAIEEGKTLLELRTHIRGDLQKELEQRVVQELDEQLLRELDARNDVPLPPSMVDKYLASGLEEMKRRQLQSGQPVTPEQEAEYQVAGRPHAEKALRGMLLMEALRAKEDIKVRPEDVDERIEEIAAEHGFEVDRYREFVKSGDEKDRIEYDLLERRAYDFLLSRAEIEDVPADTDVLAEKE